MATPEKLVSAFEVHTKRRKSTENTTSPVRPKRTRSSMSQCDDSTSTPVKLSLSPRVSLEDISSAHKSTPNKTSNGSAANNFSSEENSGKKKSKKGKKSRSEPTLEGQKTLNGFLITDGKPVKSSSANYSTKSPGTSLKKASQEKENFQGNVTKLSMGDNSDEEIIVDQLSDYEDSDLSRSISPIKSSQKSIHEVKTNGRNKEFEKSSSNASEIEKQLDMILKGPVNQNQSAKSCKTPENEKQSQKSVKSSENQRKSLNVAEKVKNYEKNEKSGGFEVDNLPSTSKSSDNKKTVEKPAKTPEKSAKIVEKTAKSAEKSTKTPEKSEKTAEKKLINDANPIEDANNLFIWLIHPMPMDDFFKKNWERAPLHVIRQQPNYYKTLLSTPLIDEILRKNRILFTKNIDVTTYTDGKRETHNPEGRAEASVVWDYYSNGCSIRMLNPQTYVPRLHQLNATLQELFGCFVGANFYLTPPGTQGFAPHYDDIEAFILQIEGKKRWRLYKPRSPEEFLPRESSRNFDQSEIGEPILDVVLKAGDMLYFPRGTIHQATTLENHHSLHITLSAFQKNSWGDLIEKLLPDALETTINSDSELREGLPLNILHELDAETRETLEEKVKSMLHKVIENMDVVKAIDEMAKKHIHDFLPPVLSPSESKCSIVEGAEKMTEGGVIVNRVAIEPSTRIRLIRKHAVRLVNEEGEWRIYYSSENSNEYHEYELKCVDVDEKHVATVQMIISSYPEFVKVEDLPIDDEDVKMSVVRDLWEKRIILTEKPLDRVD